MKAELERRNQWRFELNGKEHAAFFRVLDMSIKHNLVYRGYSLRMRLIWVFTGILEDSSSVLPTRLDVTWRFKLWFSQYRRFSTMVRLAVTVLYRTSRGGGISFILLYRCTPIYIHQDIHHIHYTRHMHSRTHRHAHHVTIVTPRLPTRNIVTT